MSRSLENPGAICDRRNSRTARVEFARRLLRSFLYLLSLIYERLVQFRLFLYRKRHFP